MNRAIKLVLVVLLALPLTVWADGHRTREVVALKGILPLHGLRAQRTTRADDSRQGVKATLKYEQIADMTTARMAHQAFPSGDGLVVVGGRTTGFQLTKTAELWQNGTWTKLTLSNAHDGAFSVRLSDGRYMVGGGFSSGKGVGQSTAVEIYDPQTRTFSAGPQLTVARAQCKAISVGSKVYVSGNWYADDATMDMYDGTSFKAVGETDDRSNPYMMADREGCVYVLSVYDTRGGSFGFYTDEDGDQLLLADKYSPSTGETRYFGLPFSPQLLPMALPDDTRSSDYHITYDGNNCYLMLAKTANSCSLYMLDLDDSQLYVFNSFDIPMTDDAGKAITWRGGVIVNESKQEVYLIGASGTVDNQILHIISLNYVSDEWTIATGTGFSHNMLSATWTLMGDGRLACTGGGIKDNTDAQRKAYIFTPPVAGQGSEDIPDNPSAGGPTLIVWLKSGEKVSYQLADAPVTSFSDGKLIISTNKATISYERKNVLRYTFENVVTKGIELMPGERRVEINREGDEITFRGLTVGSFARVYSVNGMLIEQHRVTDNQPQTISLQNRPNGVYIVKAGTETIKIMKR